MSEHKSYEPSAMELDSTSCDLTYPLRALLGDNTAQPPENNLTLLPDENYQLMEDGRYLDLDNEVAGILMSTEPHQNQQMVNVKNVSESCTIQQVHTDPTVEQPSISTLEQEKTHMPAHPHPLYNPKQADIVEKRLAVLRRMIEEGRITNSRKKYLFESRHLHAKNRKQTPGGTFDRKSGPGEQNNNCLTLDKRSRS